MELGSVIDSIKGPLKCRGYKKKNTTWYKVSDYLTIIFNIQKSQYSSDVWYYNFGIGINELEDKPITTITRCHITERLDMKMNGKEIAPDILYQAVISWENKYGNLNELRTKALENKLPKSTTKQAITYLTFLTE